MNGAFEKGIGVSPATINGRVTETGKMVVVILFHLGRAAHLISFDSR